LDPLKQLIIVQEAKNKKYKLWVDEGIVKEGMGFYGKWWGYGLANLCAQPGKKIPITSLWRYLKDRNIFTLWAASRSLFITNGRQPILQPFKKLFSFTAMVTRRKWKISGLEKERLGMNRFHSTFAT
jgi:hypothetical protein